MKTFKSFTSVEQSRKLEEILPLESADFVWLIGRLHTDGPRYEVVRTRNEVSEPENCLPCWSLAALLNVIPYNVTFNRAVYRFKLVKFSDHWQCYHENFGTVSTEIFKADNPVDACYKMIIKLKELNLL